MAYSRSVFTCDAIGGVAFCRTVIIPCDRAPVLVARGSALAERFTARPVDDPLSFFCHAAVRHPFRISGILRPSNLSGLLVLITPVRFFSTRGPAVCCRLDVDLRHSGVSGGRSDLSHAAALAREISWH